MKFRLQLASGLAVVFLAAVSAGAKEITAVSAKTSDDYVRATLPDGSIAPETYAFGEGGLWGFARDETIDKLHFLDIARVIAVPLAKQQFVPTRAASQTKLLIMLYWGTTAGSGSGASSSMAYENLSASLNVQIKQPTLLPGGRVIPPGGDPRKSLQTMDDSAVFMMTTINHVRDQTDSRNARLLGYDAELVDAEGKQFTALRFRKDDLLDEIEDNRYFVVLMAYDFQLLAKEKKHKLLWETRYSIRERNNDFSKELAAMSQNAAKYFGRDSHGLVRKPLFQGHVEIGDPNYIDTEPDKK